MTGPTGDQAVRSATRDAAWQLRGVLAALVDPDQEFTASAATRNRMEGAVAALDQVAGYPGGDGQGAPAGLRS